MGSLPVSQAGAGSAVNDTIREVGGTLGVAVVGSTLSTVYGPRVVDGLGALHVPAAAVARASDSVVGGMHVALALPGPAAAQASSGRPAVVHGRRAWPARSSRPAPASWPRWRR